VSEHEPVVWIDDLDDEVCWKLLAHEPIGRLAFVADGSPRVYPLNHRVAGRSVVFRTESDSGLVELLDGREIAFEVDGADATAETGWSVLVTGHLEAVAAGGDVTDVDVHPWAPGDKDTWVRLVPDAISGRAISRRREAAGFVPYRPTH
jgi:hypothetical protein